MCLLLPRCEPSKMKNQSLSGTYNVILSFLLFLSLDDCDSCTCTVLLLPSNIRPSSAPSGRPHRSSPRWNWMEWWWLIRGKKERIRISLFSFFEFKSNAQRIHFHLLVKWVVVGFWDLECQLGGCCRRSLTE